MNQYDLNTPLLSLKGMLSKGQVEWTIGNAVEGVQIFGGIGSGKTSGSGRTLALKYLAAGFGGLVLTVKPDEKSLWEDYCKITDRSSDLLIVEPGKNNFFNFLDYESGKTRGGETDNLVQVLKTVIRAGEEKDKGVSDDGFWESALDMLIFNVIDLCKLAYGRTSIQQMYDIVQTLPKAEQKENDDQSAFGKAFKRAEKNINDQVDGWMKKQSVEELRKLNEGGLYDEAATNAVSEARTFKIVHQFFSDTLLNLHEKTRSIIDFSFTGFLFRLLRDPVYALFCSNASTFTPEDSLDGKIILINLPVKEYHKIGRDSQIMFKYIWQRAMEKRNIADNGRPVFLWADEAQNFLHEHDPDFQATARSSRIATVYLSQNLPNYYANMGGAKSEYKVKSFLGTLSTKIFHANADVETNRYASELIGDGNFVDTSRTNAAAGQFSASRTMSVKIDRIIRPEMFNALKTGGTKNNHVITAYIHLQGSQLPDGLNHTRLQFDQNYIPNLKTVSP